MITLLNGDAVEMLRTLPDESVHCVVTSPPYWGLRDYGVDGQIGIEETMAGHITALVAVFREVRRVLRKDGTLWLNYGDAYAGSGKGGNPGDSPHVKQKTNVGSLSVRDRVQHTPGLKAKDRMLLPARVAIALQEDGWWVRDEIIWHKPNPMPISVRDRTTPAHEMVYLLTKSARYFYDQEAIKEPSVTGDSRRPYAPGQVDARGNGHDRGGGQRRKVKVPGGWDKGEGAHGTIHRDGRTSAEYVEMDVAATRNKRSVWTLATRPFPEAHFATFPPDLIRPMILAGCPADGTVLDPFAGAGTTGLVCQELSRNAVLIELSPAYCDIIRKRLKLIPTLDEMVA